MTQQTPASVPVSDGAEPAPVVGLDDRATHPFDPFRRAVVEALGITYGLPEMFGGSRYPTDAEIVSWVATEHERVRKMHDGHHVGIEGFCPDCGMYGKGSTDGN